MTRERIVGILLGISIGTFVGFYLRPEEQSNRSDSNVDPGPTEKGDENANRSNFASSWLAV